MVHKLRQMVITVGAPPQLEGREGRSILAGFYGELLGMQVVDERWLRIALDSTSPLQLALDGDGWSDARPPRWRDPDHPQQAHLDLASRDPEACARLAISLGATALEDFDDHKVLADPAGHPFCVWPEASATTRSPAVLRQVTFDCFSPRSLVSFYEGLFGTQRRLEDTAERVTLAVDDDRFPDLGFQHAQFVAARWPDDEYPAQFHLDLRFEDGKEPAVERAERFGAIRLPQLSDASTFADPAGHPFCL